MFTGYLTNGDRQTIQHGDNTHHTFADDSHLGYRNGKSIGIDTIGTRSDYGCLTTLLTAIGQKLFGILEVIAINLTAEDVTCRDFGTVFSHDQPYLTNRDHGKCFEYNTVLPWKHKPVQTRSQCTRLVAGFAFCGDKTAIGQ